MSTQATHIYLSLIPEALILSQLPPDTFGRYLAVGNRRQVEGPAIFFELEETADLSEFRIDRARERCIAHPNGDPHRSTYVAVYNVIPRVPLDAIRRAYLTTASGITLPLEPGEWTPAAEDKFFMYQELGPVYPRAVSRLNPAEFCAHVTDPEALVTLPRLAFIDLKLGPFAADPMHSAEHGMPYPNLDHLRECLGTVATDEPRKTKIVNRGLQPDILFYMIRTGLFIGDHAAMRFFPMPSEEVLEKEHFLWWHSSRSPQGY